MNAFWIMLCGSALAFDIILHCLIMLFIKLRKSFLEFEKIGFNFRKEMLKNNGNTQKAARSTYMCTYIGDFQYELGA